MGLFKDATVSQVDRREKQFFQHTVEAPLPVLCKEQSDMHRCGCAATARFHRPSGNLEPKQTNVLSHPKKQKPEKSMPFIWIWKGFISGNQSRSNATKQYNLQCIYFGMNIVFMKTHDEQMILLNYPTYLQLDYQLLVNELN